MLRKNSEEGVPGGSPYELFHLRNFKKIVKSVKLALIGSSVNARIKILAIALKTYLYIKKNFT